MSRRRREEGQATVELALLLPLLVTLLLGVVQVGLVVRSSLAVSQAARVAARVAVVDPRSASVAEAARRATGLAPSRVVVTLGGDRRPGGWAIVTVRYADPTDVPLVGRLVPAVTLEERLVVKVE